MDVDSATPGGDPVVPRCVELPYMTPDIARGLRWFTAAAVVTWIACALWPLASVLNGSFTGWPAAVCLGAIMTCGAAMIAILTLARLRRHIPSAVPVLFALVEAVAAIAVNVTTAWYLGGTGAGMGLVVIVAAQLPYFLRSPHTWIWIVIQTVALRWLIYAGKPQTLESFVFTLAAFGFQAFAAASSILVIKEGRARANLARANAELNSTRELLAESSRTAERLRISRDLHDTLGHHLSALSLQLDVAGRLTEGKAAEHVQQAHAITRLLLGDVRNVVSSLRESGRLNVSEAIRALVIQPIDAHVHLDAPDTLIVEDAARAEALLRAVQEILTNTARHARASNLWIRLESANEGVVLQTRDDGRGADALTLGNGLTGMRERFEEHGGGVDIRSGDGGGFEVHAYLPLPASA
jgi:signal transduction histidine kinase